MKRRDFITLLGGVASLMFGKMSVWIAFSRAGTKLSTSYQDC
jgi:hypothetical protein